MSSNPTLIAKEEEWRKVMQLKTSSDDTVKALEELEKHVRTIVEGTEALEDIAATYHEIQSINSILKDQEKEDKS